MDALRVDGATEWAVFWHRPPPGTVLTFARALGEFGATLMITGNIPGQTQTMPMAIYFAVEAGAMSEGWFWSAVILVLALVGIVVVNASQGGATAHRS
jgi:molybdate transport system permease protein